MGGLTAFKKYLYGYMFTAENDGMALITIDPSGDGLCYVSDRTAVTTVYKANGFTKGREIREWFPIVKGHSYELGGNNAGDVKISQLYFKKY